MASRFSINGLEVRRLRRVVARVNHLAPKMKALPDEELQGLTAKFRQRLAAGESLDHLMVEAFAAMREADRRVLGLYPYDVQVMGAAAMCKGQIIEMKTGEGKTLVATMALYLMGLTGKGAFLVTTNEYLARRDQEEMGPVYRWMGESVALGFSTGKKELTEKQKRAVYRSDIIYTTNSALGFDYLFDNLAADAKHKYMRPFYFAIVDEADAVLLDAATSPLVVATTYRSASDFLGVSDEFIYTLEKKRDYKKDEEKNQAWLTNRGVKHMEKFFQVSDPYSGHQKELVRQVNLALKAHKVMERDKDYVVTPSGEVALLDRANGRVLEGMKLQAGLHQAIEMKEQANLSPVDRVMASITYQSLFNRFDRLAGMTGTAKVAEQEFINNYGVKVVQIPTNRPVIRRDLPDRIYLSLPDKLMASLKLVKHLHQVGRPILLVTANVDVSEIYSELLLREGIPHSVLNAKNAAKEAAIIKEAGQFGAVTVATTMAGRGTDIKLGVGVAKMGGLAVIGTEKMTSKRVDQQLQGRAGRQGDPGSSQFFVSLEDDVVLKHRPKWVEEYVRRRKRKGSTGDELRGRKFRRVMEAAQVVSDEAMASERQHSLAMDIAVQRQRSLVYQERDRLIQHGDAKLDYQQIMKAAFSDFYDQAVPMDQRQFQRFVLDNLSYRWRGQLSDDQLRDKRVVVKELLKIANEELVRKEGQFETPAERANFYRVATLKAIDECWVEEVDNLDQLRHLVGDRAIAQRNPMAEYYQLAYHSFLAMRRDLRLKITRHLALSRIMKDKNGKIDVYFN